MTEALPTPWDEAAERLRFSQEKLGPPHLTPWLLTAHGQSFLTLSPERTGQGQNHPFSH